MYLSLSLSLSPSFPLGHIILCWLTKNGNRDHCLRHQRCSLSSTLEYINRHLLLNTKWEESFGQKRMIIQRMEEKLILLLWTGETSFWWWEEERWAFDSARGDTDGGRKEEEEAGALINTDMSGGLAMVWWTVTECFVVNEEPAAECRRQQCWPSIFIRRVYDFWRPGWRNAKDTTVHTQRKWFRIP